MKIFRSIGEHATEIAGAVRECMAILGETTVEFLLVPFNPRRFRVRDFMLAFERASFDALPVMSGVGFLLGVILAFQSAAALRTFGVESFVANLLSIALFRELGPLVAAILLAGRSGSAFAAEIGAMKVDEEIDALVTMGLRPVRFLAMPRIAAAMVAMPVVTIFVELAGLVGGAIVLKMMRVPDAVYWAGVISAADVFSIVLGLAKAVVFGALVALVGCTAGMRTRSTADGVGVAATSAVVGGIVAIALADGIIAVICNFWGV